MDQDSMLYEGDPPLYELLGVDHEERLSRALHLLGFVLIIDGCARNCQHCPAYGNPVRPRIMPLETVRSTLATLRQLYSERRIPVPSRAMMCWRISDPLDYQDDSGGKADCVDVAALWRRSLGQGLYVVTNGSDGRVHPRRTLERMSRAPHLVSQIKLTITPFDREWGTDRYYEHIKDDVGTLAPLWNLPSERPEDPRGRRFRINVKITPSVQSEARALVQQVLGDLGYSRAEVSATMLDPHSVSFKPVYDFLGDERSAPIPDLIRLPRQDGKPYKSSADKRVRYWFGLRPDNSWLVVDMFRFREFSIAPGVIPPISRPGKTSALEQCT